MRNLQFADDIWRKIKLRNKYVKWFIKHKVAVLGVVACLLVGGLGFSIYKYKTDIWYTIMGVVKNTDVADDLTSVVFTKACLLYTSDAADD